MIRNHFGKAGSVYAVRIPLKEDGYTPKGFCHVEFASPDDAKNALNTLAGQSLEGRALRLDMSAPRQGGGGGRGGGFGGGRGGDRGRGGFGRGGDRGGRGGGRGFGGRGRGGPQLFNTNKGIVSDFQGKGSEML